MPTCCIDGCSGEGRRTRCIGVALLRETLQLHDDKIILVDEQVTQLQTAFSGKNRGADCLSGPYSLFHQTCLKRSVNLETVTNWKVQRKRTATDGTPVVEITVGDVRHFACEACLLAVTECVDVLYAGATDADMEKVKQKALTRVISKQKNRAVKALTAASQRGPASSRVEYASFVMKPQAGAHFRMSTLVRVVFREDPGLAGEAGDVMDRLYRKVQALRAKLCAQSKKVPPASAPAAAAGPSGSTGRDPTVRRRRQSSGTVVQRPGRGRGRGRGWGRGRGRSQGGRSGRSRHSSPRSGSLGDSDLDDEATEEEQAEAELEAQIDAEMEEMDIAEEDAEAEVEEILAALEAHKDHPRRVTFADPGSAAAGVAALGVTAAGERSTRSKRGAAAAGPPAAGGPPVAGAAAGGAAAAGAATGAAAAAGPVAARGAAAAAPAAAAGSRLLSPGRRAARGLRVWSDLCEADMSPSGLPDVVVSRTVAVRTALSRSTLDRLFYATDWKPRGDNDAKAYANDEFMACAAMWWYELARAHKQTNILPVNSMSASKMARQQDAPLLTRRATRVDGRWDPNRSSADYSVWLLPMNIELRHWWLLVAERKGKHGSLTIYDSWPHEGEAPQTTVDLLELVSEDDESGGEETATPAFRYPHHVAAVEGVKMQRVFAGVAWEVQVAEGVPKQKDGFSCGYMVAEYGARLATGRQVGSDDVDVEKVIRDVVEGMLQYNIKPFAG